MKTLLLALLTAITMTNALASDKIELVRVYKNERRMELVGADNQVVKTYKIMLGRNPVGHKVQEGDFKTPEGAYLLDTKNPKSKFYKAIRVSYPNKVDVQTAKDLGVSPGGDIMIHGYPNNFKEMKAWLKSVGLGFFSDGMIRASLPYFDWTSGCIAVTDEEIDEIYNLISLPTKIIINP